MSSAKDSQRSMEREERIAASMRENLKRRKEQQRARQEKLERQSAQQHHMDKE